MARLMWRRILTAAGVIGATVALHEAAHAVLAVRGGGKVKEIGIGFGPALLRGRAGGIPIVVRALPLGGYAAVDVDEIPPDRRIPMLLAGPLANIAVGLPLMLAWRGDAQVVLDRDRPVGLAGLIGTVGALLRAAAHGPRAVVQLAGAINVGLGVMNLLPVYPLDGGHLALAVMERRGISLGARVAFARLTTVLFFLLVQAATRADLRRLRKPN